MSIQIRVAGLFASAIVASAVSAESAVEWKSSDGGNGHWYLPVTAMSNRSQALALAAALNGHLATLTSPQENAFLAAQNFPSNGGAVAYWTGGVRASPGYGLWSWMTGEPWSYSNFDVSEPNGCCGQDVRFCIFRAHPGHEGKWDDTSSESLNFTLIEFDADCNSDGLVDYGQIIHGELEDLNANGVPDICETSITSVLPPSVPAQGGTTITIRGNGFPANPTVLIGGIPATNVSRESLTRITATSPVVLPGMTSVSVNGFTLPDGIYIRPECGSDLDQNGTVDTADISIILLDFGPCYEPPGAFDAPAPTPLLLPDATTPAPTPTAPQSARPAPQPRERSS